MGNDGEEDSVVVVSGEGTQTLLTMMLLQVMVIVCCLQFLCYASACPCHFCLASSPYCYCRCCHCCCFPLRICFSQLSMSWLPEDVLWLVRLPCPNTPFPCKKTVAAIDHPFSWIHKSPQSRTLCCHSADSKLKVKETFLFRSIPTLTVQSK